MKEELRDFGLSDNEIEIYLALIQKGELGPTEIAKQTGFARSYVYDILRRLQEKGLVSTIVKNQKRNYVAISTKQLIEISKQRLISIEKVTNELEALRSTQKGNIHAELQTGKYVFRTLLNDILIHLKKGDEALWYGIDDEFLISSDKTIKERLNLYLTKIVNAGITERLIVREGIKKIPQAKTTKYRFLPKDTIGNLAFIAYADRLAILLWGQPNYLIFIINKEVSISYRNQFEILWKTAKP